MSTEENPGVLRTPPVNCNDSAVAEGDFPPSGVGEEHGDMKVLLVDDAVGSMPPNVHKAMSSRTAEALREFKRKMGLCCVEGCEHKAVSHKDGVDVCQHHLDNGIDAPVEPLRRSKKRKSEMDALDESSDLKLPPSGSVSTSSPRGATCLVDGCEKLRAKSGYCTRHFKDPNAPIRCGPADYERRFCMKEGCEKLRSKGNYCHRHNQDINAPIRNQVSQSLDRKKQCAIEGCDRLQVKGGFCSRHSKNPEAPVKETPAFSFDADARWDELYPELEAFAKANGHARYPTSKKTDMAKFVTQIRSVYRQKKNKGIQMNPNADPDTIEPDLTNSKLLTPDRMEALKAIGFEFQLWTVEPGQWEQRFQELLEYKQVHGNFHVTSRENATLSSWCKTQRQRYKNTMAIYQGLYGAEFSGTQLKAQQLFDKARSLAVEAKKKGHSLEPSSVTEAKHLMDADKICKLTAVGFEWDLQKDAFEESWENRYLELMRYKLVNGNCRVPKGGENPQLGQWVKQMRKYHSWKQEGKSYPKTFTDERINRLNELGFEWRLKDYNNAILPVEDLKQDHMADVERRQPQNATEPLHRQVNEKPMTMEEMTRYEPFRANVSLYEQRGWL